MTTDTNTNTQSLSQQHTLTRPLIEEILFQSKSPDSKNKKNILSNISSIIYFKKLIPEVYDQFLIDPELKKSSFQKFLIDTIFSHIENNNSEEIPDENKPFLNYFLKVLFLNPNRFFNYLNTNDPHREYFLKEILNKDFNSIDFSSFINSIYASSSTLKDQDVVYKIIDSLSDDNKKIFSQKLNFKSAPLNAPLMKIHSLLNTPISIITNLHLKQNNESIIHLNSNYLKLYLEHNSYDIKNIFKVSTNYYNKKTLPEEARSWIFNMIDKNKNNSKYLEIVSELCYKNFNLSKEKTPIQIICDFINSFPVSTNKYEQPNKASKDKLLIHLSKLSINKELKTDLHKLKKQDKVVPKKVMKI